MFFGDVALSIPKTIVDKRMADYQEMRKEADKGLYDILYNNPNTSIAKNLFTWRSGWSDIPCHRLYYGGIVDGNPALKAHEWRDYIFYMKPNSQFYMPYQEGHRYIEMAYEYCCWDFTPGESIEDRSYTNGEESQFRVYVKADISKYGTEDESGFAQSHHLAFWNYWLDFDYRRLVRATNMMNLFNKKYYENGKVIHPTDDTGFVPS